MKKIVFFTFLWISSPKAFSQVSAWDSSYRPAIYKTMVDQFRYFSHSKRDIIFLGNSITFWGNWQELLNSDYVKDRGIPGDITFGLIERLDEIIKNKPRKIFILIGINDLAKGIPDSIIIQNYIKIINKIKLASPLTKIYFQTLLPTNNILNSSSPIYFKQDHIKNINTALKQIALEKKIIFINLYQYFVDKIGNLKKEYTWDGIHLTIKGYIKWVNILKQGNYLN